MKLAESVLEELWFGEDDEDASAEHARRSLAAKLAELEGLRPFPAVVQRVIGKLAEPDYHVRAIRVLIEEDPALAARVLRVANSPAYGGREHVASVHDAVVRIGAKAVREIIISVATMATFRDVSGFGAEVRDHSARCAAVVRTLAVRTGQPVDGMYLAGLLHDIGKLLLLQSGERSYLDVVARWRDVADQLHLTERDALGYDHAVLGAHVLAGWRFPEPLPKMVAWHHQPMRAYAAGGELASQVALLRVADQLVRELTRPGAPEPAFLEDFCGCTDAEVASIDADALGAVWGDLQVAARDAAGDLAG